MSCRRACLSFLSLLAALILFAGSAHADGSLPPQHYNYLHPPPALASENTQPSTGLRVLPTDMLNGVGWGAFTPDAQAGVTGIRHSLKLAPKTTAVVFRIQPVETPPGLPTQVAADGNSYRITVHEDPSGKAPGIKMPLHVVLRWPHIPLAIYTYQNNRWRQLCYSDQSILTATTISCPIKAFGLFVAVTLPSNVKSNTPATPVSWLNKYIPLIAAAALILAAIILGYLVTRPGSRRTEDRQTKRRG